MADGAYVFAVEGLENLGFVDEIPPEVTRAAQLAVNATIKKGYAAVGRQIRKQINFPASYLTGANGKLQITQYATATDLQARISGPKRPTSLARFATGSLKLGGRGRSAGVTVEVRPGAAMHLKRAFLIKLRSGNSADGPNANIGLAVRTKPGQTLQKSSKAKQIGNNLWLLYGPSVSQAFVNNSGRGVASDVAPELGDFLESEFIRVLDLKI